MIPANRCVLSLLAALAVGLGQAGAEQLPLKVYTAADGLASDLVRCVLADSRGFLWFGTGDGISRFDGSGFTNLTAADGLPGSDVRSIQESRDGTYWAATSEGLFHWDPARLNGVRAAIHPGAGQSDNVRALVEDRSGTIWIATHGGLFRLEPGRPAPQPVSLDSPEKNPLVSMVHTIKEDQDGNLWIGTEAGLFRRSREGTLTAIRTPDGAPHSVRSILAEKTGTVWAGSHTEGLFEVRVSGRAESAAIEVRRVLTRSSGLAGDYVTSLYATADGELWAGCFPGLSEIAPDRKSARSYAREDGFPANSVWAFAEDRDQDLWIGSDHGVMRLARDGFRRFDARDGLASTCVDSLFENREGQLCAFTRGISSEEVIADRSFVECFDGKRFHAQAPALRPGVSFGWGTSQVVLQDKRGECWVPTIGGLYRFPAVSFASLQTSSQSRIYTETDGLPSNVLYRLFEDSRGDLWVGSVGERRGLAVWLRASDTFRRFGEKDGIPLEEPRAIVEDAKGAVWIGFASGLARYRDGAMSFFRPADGVPSGGVTALHRDLQGRLWIATGAGGVAFVERPQDERPQFVSYGPERGLSTASIPVTGSSSTSPPTTAWSTATSMLPSGTGAARSGSVPPTGSPVFSRPRSPRGRRPPSSSRESSLTGCASRCPTSVPGTSRCRTWARAPRPSRSSSSRSSSGRGDGRATSTCSRESTAAGRRPRTSGRSPMDDFLPGITVFAFGESRETARSGKSRPRSASRSWPPFGSAARSSPWPLPSSRGWPTPSTARGCATPSRSSASARAWRPTCTTTSARGFRRSRSSPRWPAASRTPSGRPGRSRRSGRERGGS